MRGVTQPARCCRHAMFCALQYDMLFLLLTRVSDAVCCACRQLRCRSYERRAAPRVMLRQFTLPLCRAALLPRRAYVCHAMPRRQDSAAMPFCKAVFTRQRWRAMARRYGAQQRVSRVCAMLRDATPAPTPDDAQRAACLLRDMIECDVCHGAC